MAWTNAFLEVSQATKLDMLRFAPDALGRSPLLNRG